MGIALPSAGSCARGVNQDAVEFSFGGQPGSSFPQSGAKVERPGARSPALQTSQTPFGSVGRPNQAFIAHQVRKMEQFAPFAGTRVPPCFSWGQRAYQPNSLGTDVLDLELATMKFRCEE